VQKQYETKSTANPRKPLNEMPALRRNLLVQLVIGNQVDVLVPVAVGHVD
jgi:hypothetical protein